MTLRNLAIWGVIALLAAGLYSMVTQGAKTAAGGELSYSQLLANIEAGRVKTAVLHNQSIDVIQSDGGKHTVTTPLDGSSTSAETASAWPATPKRSKRRSCLRPAAR